MPYDILSAPLTFHYERLKQRWNGGAWNTDDQKFLADVIMFVDIGGVFPDFDPNEWYPLGFAMAQKHQPALWKLCIADLSFKPPVPLRIPHQSDSAHEIIDRIQWWLYWYPRNTLPQWDEAKQELTAHQTQTHGSWTINDVKALLQAFATPQYCENIHKQLTVLEGLDLPMYPRKLTESGDVSRCLSWLVSLKMEDAKPEVSYVLPEVTPTLQSNS